MNIREENCTRLLWSKHWKGWRTKKENYFIPKNCVVNDENGNEIRYVCDDIATIARKHIEKSFMI